MIILKFALLFFLMTMTLTLVQLHGHGPLIGGPYYFLDMPGNHNPVKPDLQVTGWQAFHRRNVWKVWFDNRGHPVDLQLFRDGVKTEEIKLVYDKEGAVRMRGQQKI